MSKKDENRIVSMYDLGRFLQVNPHAIPVIHGDLFSIQLNYVQSLFKPHRGLDPDRILRRVHIDHGISNLRDLPEDHDLCVTVNNSARVIVGSGAQVIANHNSFVDIMGGGVRVEANDGARIRILSHYDCDIVAKSSNVKVILFPFSGAKLFGPAKVIRLKSCIDALKADVDIRHSSIDSQQHDFASSELTLARIFLNHYGWTQEGWCCTWGLPIVNNRVRLYKAVDENFLSPHKMKYTPGSKPEAPDWDHGRAECGNGLHFTYSIEAAKSIVTWMMFDRHGFQECLDGSTPPPKQIKIVSCEVELKDMRTPKPSDYFLEHAKVWRAASPIAEVM